ncbi:MAG: peptidylprolyl isomerase [Nitrospirae bacterium]|nr:peptidylprolyl isomerase [Nitrospirota bacterium]
MKYTCVDGGLAVMRAVLSGMVSNVAYALLFVLLCFAHVNAAENDVVLVVNGEKFIRADLEQAFNVFLPAAVFHGGVNDEMRNKYREDAINFMVEQQLLYEAALKNGVKVDRKVVDAQVESAIKKYGSKRDFKKALKESGYSYDNYIYRIKKKLVVDKFTDEYITKKSRYDDAELRSYYDKNIENFKRPAARYIWHILVETAANASAGEREQRRIFAEMVAQRAKSGDNFEMLASQYSDDDYRVKGGLLGLVHKGQLVSQVEEVAFSLKDDEVAGPIETLYGFHVVKVGKQVEQGIVPFDKAVIKLRASLQENRYEAIRREVLEERRKSAVITVMDSEAIKSEESKK